MAVITHLPTAAVQPVINPSRRGRFPRGITAIWRGRDIRFQRLLQQEKASKAAEAVRSWASVMSFAQHEYGLAQNEVSRLNQGSGVSR